MKHQEDTKHNEHTTNSFLDAQTLPLNFCDNYKHTKKETQKHVAIKNIETNHDKLVETRM